MAARALLVTHALLPLEAPASRGRVLGDKLECVSSGGGVDFSAAVAKHAHCAFRCRVDTRVQLLGVVPSWVVVGATT